jgi:hypothetical protein
LKTLAFLFLLTVAPLVHADPIQVNISTTFTATAQTNGNVRPSSCEGCIHTFNISFQYDAPLHQLEQIIPGSLVLESNGFLGSFTGGFITWSGIDGSRLPEYMSFHDGSGTEMDINFEGRSDGTLVVANAILYSCGTGLCQDAYGLDRSRGFIPATSLRVTYTPVGVPEPSWLSLLALGLLSPAMGYRRA